MQMLAPPAGAPIVVKCAHATPAPCAEQVEVVTMTMPKLQPAQMQLLAEHMLKGCLKTGWMWHAWTLSVTTLLSVRSGL